jgi:hypothetical protein
MNDQRPLDPAAGMEARTRELARLILEEMDKPTSPEREASLIQKEREDSEAMEHFYRLSGQRKATVVEALSTLAFAIEALPLEGPFNELRVEIEGLCGRKALLSLAPSPSRPLKRYIALTVLTPTGLSNSSQWLEWGTNAELAAFLRRESIVPEIGAVAGELVISLQQHRLA